MFEDGVWRTVAGRRIFIKNGQSLTDAMKNSGKFKEKEEISLSKAKQRFKNNIDKYGVGGAFEDAILYYNLKVEEIKSLYKYAEKMENFKFYKAQIDSVYDNYVK